MAKAVSAPRKSAGAVLGATTLTINKVEIPVSIEFEEVSRLLFYADNPRIYSLVRGDGACPSQDDIFEALKEKQHVEALRDDIRENGGLLDPVIVRTATMEVIEGNSRLAAYRLLCAKDPAKWGLIKAMMLPNSFDDDMVFALLNQYHLKGKTKWDPYERAGFVYRRWTQSKPRLSTQELSRICIEEEKDIKLMLKSYEFMREHKLEPNQWSYAYELCKSTIIGKQRESIAGFDDNIVLRIKKGELQAVDVRDKLREVCKNDKVLRKFLTGSVSLGDAFEELEETGATSALLSRMKNFNVWFADPDKLEARLKTARGQELEKLQFELKKLAKRTKRLEDRFLKAPTAGK